jgi:hypothetical protein
VREIWRGRGEIGLDDLLDIVAATVLGGGKGERYIYCPGRRRGRSIV